MRIVRATLRTTTGTQDFTIPGFGTPIGALFVIGMGLQDAVAADNLTISFGMTDGTNHGCVSIFSDHSAITANTTRRCASDEIFMVMDDGAGTVDAEANFDSFITDGVRINVTVVGSPTARLLTVYLVSGVGGVTCVVGNDLFAADDATVTITPGLETDALIMVSASQPFDDAADDTAVFRTGVAGVSGGVLTQNVLAFRSTDGAANADPGARIQTNKMYVADRTPNQSATLGNITSTSFDLTSGSVDISAQRFLWMALNLGKDGNAYSGVFDTPTVTGEKTWNGVGFKPGFGLGFMSMVPTVDADHLDAGGGCHGIFGFNEDEAFCNSLAEQDAAATTNNQALSDDKAVNLDKHGGGDALEADFVEFSTDGVILDFTIVDATVRKFIGLFIGV